MGKWAEALKGVKTNEYVQTNYVDIFQKKVLAFLLAREKYMPFYEERRTKCPFLKDGHLLLHFANYERRLIYGEKLTIGKRFSR